MQHVFFITKTYTLYHIPFNPNLGGLFRDLLCGEGKNTPFLKYVRIILETWNLERKYRNICCFRKCTFYYQGPLKVVINKNLRIADHASEIRLSDCSRLAINRKIDDDIIISWHYVMDIFFSDFAMFVLLILVTGSSFMSK